MGLEALRAFIHGGMLDTLVSPARLGALLTRKAILRMAQDLGISVAMDDRNWMLRRLAEQAADLGEWRRFIELLVDHLEAIVAQYEELSSRYPELSPLLDEQREKLVSTIGELRELAKD